MAWRMKLILGAITMCLVLTLYAQSYLPSAVPYCASKERECPSEGGFERNQDGTLAVIVPYRDRFEELQLFVPFIHKFLIRQGIGHHIYIVHQIDSLRFNRASLINAGFKIANPTSEYIVMHDVDLLPLNDDLSYAKPNPRQVMHVAAPGLHPKYDYPTFVGGILIVRNEDFELANGMSNLYWGWGLEDDEFYVRLKNAHIQVVRPNVTTTKRDTFRHIHAQRQRDKVRCFDQYAKSRKRDRLTGLSNVNFTLVSTSNVRIDGAPCTVLNVKLECNYELSPWCECKTDDKIIGSKKKG